MCYNNKELSTEAVKAMNGRQNYRFKCELGFLDIINFIVLLLLFWGDVNEKDCLFELFY